MAEPITQAEKLLIAQIEAEGRERLKIRVRDFNASPVKSETCKTCLLKYRDDFGRMIPMCRLGADVAGGIQDQTGALSSLTPDEQTLMQVYRDPVLWAKLEFGWEAYWYQSGAIRCSSQRKLYRYGRRTGKTASLIVEILWCAWTKPNKKPNEAYNVLIVCPYDKQVTLIFDRLREMIGKSRRVSDSVVRDTANPQRIELSNGAIILGVSAGVRSGGNADQVRGQDGDLIVLDEAAMLDDKSIESILAILTTDPNCRIIASGTPTGTRNQFYIWSTNKVLGYREFHFTSRVAPSWSAEVEMFYRQTYSATGFAQEFMAEFGEEEAGVFQQKYIDASVTKYDLSDCLHEARNLYCMGVDWNSVGHGTHIIVQEYDTTSNMFRVVAKEVVETSEFTQDTAINRILYLDSIWHCNYIYVDVGFGGHQIETLRRIGMSMPGSNLAQKLKPVDFGSKTEIKDPRTQQAIKKYTKPLIVDLAARRLESYQCILPTSEDYQIGLVGQIRAFKVENYGRDGRPVYSSENDHTLVAWMLTIFGLIMEYTDLAKTAVTSRVRFAEPPQHRPTREQDEDRPKTGIKAEPRWDPPKLSMHEVIRGMQTGRIPDMTRRRHSSLARPRRTSF